MCFILSEDLEYLGLCPRQKRPKSGFLVKPVLAKIAPGGKNFQKSYRASTAKFPKKIEAGPGPPFIPTEDETRMGGLFMAAGAHESVRLFSS